MNNQETRNNNQTITNDQIPITKKFNKIRYLGDWLFKLK